jgi:hypothetical protein
MQTEPTVKATIEKDGTVTLVNRTGHREQFYLRGLPSPIFIVLDGNTRYSTKLNLTENSTIIEVRRINAEGELLASCETEQKS